MRKSGILGTITWIFGIILIIIAVLSLFSGHIALLDNIANILRIVNYFGPIPFIIIGIIAIIIGSNRNRAINGLIFIAIAYLIPIIAGFFN
ncbi:MAG: hypothetical protein IKZ96_01590 [Bacilli bacterium]|nr:hypothetical protein [Bacilli bacterium]